MDGICRRVAQAEVGRELADWCGVTEEGLTVTKK